MSKFHVQTNQHLFTLNKIADYQLGSDNIARMVLLDNRDLKKPNGIYLILENGTPVYTGIFSENEKYGKNFGTRHLYTRKEKQMIGHKNAYLIYHHVECDPSQKDKRAPSHPRVITHSLAAGNNVDIYLITRDEIMEEVGNDDCINLRSVEDRFIKLFCLVKHWNKYLDRTIKKYA